MRTRLVMTTLLALICILLSFPIYAADKPVIAITGFEVLGGPDYLAKLIENRFISDLSLADTSIVERNSIKDVLDEKGLAASGLAKQDTAAMGQLMGASHLLSGVLDQVSAKQSITIKVVNAETGEVKSATVPLMGSLDDTIDVVCGSVLRSYQKVDYHTDMGADLSTVPDKAQIYSIERDSPAYYGGLQVNDIITRFGGYNVESPYRIWFLMQLYEPGDEVEVFFMRGSVLYKTKVKMRKVSDGE